MRHVSITVCWWVLVLVSIGGTLPAQASVSNDLKQYFNSLGFSSNVTAPQAWHGQQAGYYTGGSVFMRTPSRNVQLVKLELPSYRSGCGGIDLFTGGFSFINSDQIIPLMQNIMNNAASYAFTLALETASPIIESTLNKWNTFASRVNQANINSCEMAEALVGGMWPRVRGAQQRVCQDVGSQKGLFADWAQAKQHCAANAFDATMSRARQDVRYQHLAFDKGNLAWMAIKQRHVFDGDDELAEFMMSLSGTVIMDKADNGPDAPVTFNPLPSLMDAKGNNLVKALLEGGEVTIYGCDTKDTFGCLHPSNNKKIVLSKDHSFGQRVKQLLDDMVSKVVADEPLTNEEIGLLQATSLPVYKMLNVQSAFERDKTVLDVTAYADVIATDILFQYLEQSLQLVRYQVLASQYSEDLLEQLRPGLDAAIEQLRQMKQTAYSRLALSIQLIQQTQVMERMLAGSLSSDLANSLSWARGLT